MIKKYTKEKFKTKELRLQDFKWSGTVGEQEEHS